MFNASKVQRLFFFNVANLSMIGIWLTGIDTVHWFSYAVPVALYFAAASGFCLGFVVSGKILGLLGVKE